MSDLTINASRATRKCLIQKCPSELEPPRMTVYKDLGSTLPGAVFRQVQCRLRLPSNGLHAMDCKAEVVELADTPS